MKVIKNERNKNMFVKLFKLMFVFIMFALFITSITEAQTTKVVYPVFSISPMVGVTFPMGDLNNSYSASWNAGLDLNLKVNRETSFFLFGGYNDLPIKSGNIGPGASVIQITAGPRYVFTSDRIRAQIFIEGALGVYIYNVKEWSFEGVSYPSTSKANFGINIGPGALIPLGGSVDLIMKAKIHDMFMTGGSQTFITAVMGVDFKL
jgi:hypothetical protein